MLFADIVVSDGWLTVIGVFVLGQLVAAVAWANRMNQQVSTLKSDVEHLSKQVTDGLRPFDQQRDRIDAVDRRVVTLEEQGRTIFKTLEKMDNKLDRIMERE